MYLIKYFKNKDIVIKFIDDNKEYIDFNYEINNRYILTPFLLVLIESTEKKNKDNVLFFRTLFDYLITLK